MSKNMVDRNITSVITPPIPPTLSSVVMGINMKNTMEKYNTKELADRWINILRAKAEYEHNDRKNGKVVVSPSLDDICNEMIAYFTGVVD